MTVTKCLHCQAKTLLYMQLAFMDVSSNNLNGTLPTAWVGLTQVSPVMNMSQV